MRLEGIGRDFDTVIFDMDGTLVDSMWMWTDIDIEYLGRFGISFRPELQRDIEGMSAEEAAVYFRDVLGVRRSIEEMRADWVEMSYAKYRDEVRPKPGAVDFILYLRSHGIRTGLATSSMIENVEACLRSNSISDLFDTVVTSSDVERGKPSPDIYLTAAARLGSDPSSCIAFEDVLSGIRAARSAGMEVVAVYDEWSEDVTIEKISEADLYIHDFRELLDALIEDR